MVTWHIGMGESDMSDTGTTIRHGALDSSALAELRESFRGQVFEPGSASFGEARTFFNAIFERRPAVALRPAGTADVIRAVGPARLSGLPLASRGGGHSVATSPGSGTRQPPYSRASRRAWRSTSTRRSATPSSSRANEDKLKRLRALKDRYDPTNLFRLNQNVAPS